MLLRLLALLAASVLSRTVVIGDLHGDYEHTMKILRKRGLVNPERKWTGGKTTLVQTGDMNDRGPDGTLLYWLFAQWREEAREAGGDIVQLWGNHESMVLCGNFAYVSPDEWERHHGGEPYEMFLNFGPERPLGREIRENFKIYHLSDDGETLFVHAGISSNFVSHTEEALRRHLLFEIDVKHCTAPRHLGVVGDYGPLWTRQLVLGPPTGPPDRCEHVKKSLQIVGAKRMVVGHTPTYDGRIHTDCGGMLIRIDSGISRWMEGAIAFVEIEDDGQWNEVVLNKNKVSVTPINLSLTEQFPPHEAQEEELPPHDKEDL